MTFQNDPYCILKMTKGSFGEDMENKLSAALRTKRQIYILINPAFFPLYLVGGTGQKQGSSKGFNSSSNSAIYRWDYSFPFLSRRTSVSVNGIFKTIRNAIWLHLDIKIENINYQSTNAETKSMDSKNLIQFRDWNVSQLQYTGSKICHFSKYERKFAGDKKIFYSNFTV